MRNIIELLEILKESIISAKEFSGLCLQTHRLFEKKIITFSEESCLDEYIDSNRPIYEPKNTREYLWLVAKGYDFIENDKWGWKPGLKKCRIKWLEERIEYEQKKT